MKKLSELVQRKVEPISLGNLTTDSKYFQFLYPTDASLYPIGIGWRRPMTSTEQQESGGTGGQVVSLYSAVPMNSPEAKQLWDKDMNPDLVLDSPQDALMLYAHEIANEFKNVPDGVFVEKPWGDFIGRKKTARWHDEALRRGLITQ